MKFKLDENLRNLGVELLREAGHDVSTVLDQQMQSASDDLILAACVREGRCLVTLDTDFANPFVYPPAKTSGIAVIRADGRGKKELISKCTARLIDALRQSSIEGRLWIVEPLRVRVYSDFPGDET